MPGRCSFAEHFKFFISRRLAKVRCPGWNSSAALQAPTSQFFTLRTRSYLCSTAFSRLGKFPVYTYVTDAHRHGDVGQKICKRVGGAGWPGGSCALYPPSPPFFEGLPACRRGFLSAALSPADSRRAAAVAVAAAGAAGACARANDSASARAGGRRQARSRSVSQSGLALAGGEGGGGGGNLPPLPSAPLTVTAAAWGGSVLRLPTDAVRAVTCALSAAAASSLAPAPPAVRHRWARARTLVLRFAQRGLQWLRLQRSRASARRFSLFFIARRRRRFASFCCCCCWVPMLMPLCSSSSSSSSKQPATYKPAGTRRRQRERRAVSAPKLGAFRSLNSTESGSGLRPCGCGLLLVRGRPDDAPHLMPLPTCRAPPQRSAHERPRSLSRCTNCAGRERCAPLAASQGGGAGVVWRVQAEPGKNPASPAFVVRKSWRSTGRQVLVMYSTGTPYSLTRPHQSGQIKIHYLIS